MNPQQDNRHGADARPAGDDAGWSMLARRVAEEDALREQLAKVPVDLRGDAVRALAHLAALRARLAAARDAALAAARLGARAAAGKDRT